MGVAAPLIVGVLSFLAFLPALTNGFVAWDDGLTLYNNPHYRGLGWSQLRWMFTTVHHSHYIPVTWLTFGADYLVWGMNPVGYHLTSLALHAGSAVVLYLVAQRLLGLASGAPALACRLGAAATALFFGVHPLRVESVAWATERRDVLAGWFFLLTVLLYLASLEARGAKRRWLRLASLGAFLLALGSKASVVTLPLILLLLDVYPLRRLPAAVWQWPRLSFRPVLTEKLPYLVLGGMGVVITVLVQDLVYRRWSPGGTPALVTRLDNPIQSAWFYVWKTALPLGLSTLYDIPASTSLTDAGFIAAVLGVSALVLVTLVLARRGPAVPALGVAYLILLAPVSGLVPVIGHDTAYVQLYDRYSYLACLPWALLLGAGVTRLVARHLAGTAVPWRCRLGYATVALGLTVLGALSWQQTRVWHDTGTLWRHAVSVNPECARCRYSLGQVLVAEGTVETALPHFAAAVQAKPADIVMRAGYGSALGRMGRWDEAAAQYRRAVQAEPAWSVARNNLAVALFHAGRWDEAVQEARAGLALRPTYVPLWITLGAAFQSRGEPGEAAPLLRRALELDPNAVAARRHLVEVYVALGREDLAREHREWLAARSGPAQAR